MRKPRKQKPVGAGSPRSSGDPIAAQILNLAKQAVLQDVAPFIATAREALDELEARLA